jgi:hypothetical protein
MKNREIVLGKNEKWSELSEMRGGFKKKEKTVRIVLNGENFDRQGGGNSFCLLKKRKVVRIV